MQGLTAFPMPKAGSFGTSVTCSALIIVLLPTCRRACSQSNLHEIVVADQQNFRRNLHVHSP